MKRAAIWMTGLLLLTGCTAQEETISHQDINKIKVSPDQKKSKYGELPNEDEQNKLSIALVIDAIYPSPEFSTLEIYNNGTNTYLVSPKYTIEKFVDGAWYEIAFPKDVIFDGRTEFIGPGGGYHHKINNRMMEKMIAKEGKYRFVKVLKAKGVDKDDVVLAHVITVGGKK